MTRLIPSPATGPIQGGAGGRFALRRGGLVAVVVLALAGGVLGGCGSTGKSADADASAAASNASEDDDILTVRDAWVKPADTGDTVIYGTIVNGTAAPASAVLATSPVAGSTELRPKPEAFTIPAHGRLALKENGPYLALLQLTKAVRVGDQVQATLTFKDRSTVQFTAQARQPSGK